MEGYQEFFEFMQGYTCFFESAAAMEEEKMRALLSDDLHRIEHAMTEHQRIAKQIEQYEGRRIALQERLGIGDKTFRQIIEMERGERRTELKQLYAVFSAAIHHIKHTNSRSLDIARLNLRILEEIAPSGVTDPQCYNNHGETVEHTIQTMNLLNKQI